MSVLTTPAGQVIFRDIPLTHTEYREIQLPFLAKTPRALYESEDAALRILVTKIILPNESEITDRDQIAKTINAWTHTAAKQVIDEADRLIAQEQEIPNEKK